MSRVAEELVRVPDYRARVAEGLRRGERAELLDQIETFQGQLDASWTLLTDAGGTLQAWSLRPERSGDEFGGALIGLALEGEPSVGAWIEPFDGGDSLYQAIAVPIRESPEGPPVGVLVAAARIDSAFVQALKRSTGSEVVFFVRDTAGVAVPVAATMPLAAVREQLGRLALGPIEADTAPSQEPIDLAEGWVGVRGAIRTASGVAVAGYVGLRSRATELAPYRRLQRAVSLAFLAGLALTLLGSLLVAARLAAPVLGLVRAARRVTDGDYDVALPAPGNDEIGELTRAFESMLTELREKQRLVEFLGGPGARRGTTPTREPSGPVPLPPVAVGSVLAGRYELLQLLGAGGMGVVYRARDRELDEIVALKTFHGDLADNPEILARFKREIRLARMITHRNVVRTHDLGEDAGLYFITMELVEGTPLDQLIRRRGRLPVEIVLPIGKQLCRALEVAHDAGVLHRDIKPQNLLLQGSGVLKVMDFGIARSMTRPESGATAGLTQAGVLIGTPGYMPPEQLLGEELDARADVYAAGAVLYECLTGARIFDSADLMASISRTLSEPPPDPRRIVPELPPSLADAVVKALAKDRAQRWSSAADMRAAFDAVGLEIYQRSWAHRFDALEALVGARKETAES
jgi:serine/threonine-protein kinase